MLTVINEALQNENEALRHDQSSAGRQPAATEAELHELQEEFTRRIAAADRTIASLKVNADSGAVGRPESSGMRRYQFTARDTELHRLQQGICNPWPAQHAALQLQALTANNLFAFWLILLVTTRRRMRACGLPWRLPAGVATPSRHACMTSRPTSPLCRYQALACTASDCDPPATAPCPSIILGVDSVSSLVAESIPCTKCSGP